MSFMDRLIRVASKTPRTRPRRRPRFRLEALEGRELLSVANFYGQVVIQAEQSGARTSVQVIDDGATVEVVSEGRTYDFDAGQVGSITYIGSRGGGDTFTSAARYTTSIGAYAGNNTVTGGGGLNIVYLEGGDNTYDGGDSPTVVYADGPNNSIHGSNVLGLPTR